MTQINNLFLYMLHYTILMSTLCVWKATFETRKREFWRAVARDAGRSRRLSEQHGQGEEITRQSQRKS